MRNMLLIIANILRVTFRKKGNIIVYLLLPLFSVFILLFVYGNGGSSSVKLGLTNNDKGALSAELKTSLQGLETYKISEVSEDEINSKLLNMELDAAIVIPDGYSEGIYNRAPMDIDIISIKGQDTTVWIQQFLNSYTDTLSKLSSASGGDRVMFDSMNKQYKEGELTLTAVKLEDKLAGRNITFSSMGFLIMFMMLGAGLINTIILKEKRDRTYHRICSAPVNSRQYIAANSITSLVIVTVQILIIQFAMKLLHIDTSIGDAVMFVILLMFGLVAIGLGLVVTSFSSSSYMAGTLNTLIMTPTCMLGGCFWPVEYMPDIMQKISYFMPQRWALNAIQKIQSDGTMSDITINLFILAGFAAALMLIAIYKFARSSNVQKFV